MSSVSLFSFLFSHLFTADYAAAAAPASPLRTSLSSILQHRRRISADTMTPINFRQRWLH